MAMSNIENSVKIVDQELGTFSIADINSVLENANSMSNQNVK